MKYVFQTDKGKVRELNEDAVDVLTNENQLLAIVADGMGGHQAGDVASHLAVETVTVHWKELTDSLGEHNVKGWLKDTITKVNNLVYHTAQTDASYQGMGTTLVVAVCTKAAITIGHIGDSRAYLINQTGLQQVTNDHSLVGELVRKGQLSAEDAQVHPQRNIILKALGTEEDLVPDIYQKTWEEQEQLLICSDGLTDKVDDQELYDILMNNEVKQASEILIQLANDRGGEDNITLTIVKNEDAEVGESSC
ncbi:MULTISPECIES: Stp1/IreP family PP2C-type Ser/Thr phosphatase [Gracilibacillus]|uniref:Stp1/IreP family PP2C-type Ser/Thr phosphatase n=1 Tax=Gracilibacillus TaxID=74385 RepID=UPI000826B20E|nr:MULTISPECIES: Stp1/IreP family PP2C-type Ser/Thr phosphatase [Gracilibacillus]